MTSRTRLPNRRLNVTESVAWIGADWLIGIGFDRAGAAREVFLNGPKIGSEAEALLDDACVLLSLLLQGGSSAADLARHLGRESVDPGAAAASPIGLAAEKILALEQAAGVGIRAAYAAAHGAPHGP